MSYPFFEPWVGKYYGRNESIFRKKILAVGNSHYCDQLNCPTPGRCGISGGTYSKNDKRQKRESDGSMLTCRSFTQHTVERYINANGHGLGRWATTYTKFGKGLTGGKMSTSGISSIWNSIAFYNYAQTNIQTGPKQSLLNTPEILSSSLSCFKYVVADLNPDIIIVWGTQVWSYLALQSINGNLPGIKMCSGFQDIPDNSAKPVMISINHPCSSSFRYSLLNGFFERFGKSASTKAKCVLNIGKELTKRLLVSVLMVFVFLSLYRYFSWSFDFKITAIVIGVLGFLFRKANIRAIKVLLLWGLYFYIQQKEFPLLNNNLAFLIGLVITSFVSYGLWTSLKTIVNIPKTILDGIDDISIGKIFRNLFSRCWGSVLLIVPFFFSYRLHSLNLNPTLIYVIMGMIGFVFPAEARMTFIMGLYWVLYHIIIHQIELIIEPSALFFIGTIVTSYMHNLGLWERLYAFVSIIINKIANLITLPMRIINKLSFMRKSS